MGGKPFGKPLFSASDKLAVFLVALSFLASLAAYPYLPEKVATHWGLYGEPNGFSGRAFGAFFLPSLALAILGAISLFERIGPLRKGGQLGENSQPYGAVKTSLSFFMLGLHAFVLSYPFGRNPNVRSVLGFLLFFLLLSIGLALPRTKRNYFLGIRTPWTLESDRVWEKTHSLGGKTFAFASLPFYASAFLPQLLFPSTILLIAISFCLAAFSYFESSKSPGK